MHSIHRTTLIPGGSEIIVYTTLSGTVGMLMPFTSREVNCALIGMLRMTTEAAQCPWLGSMPVPCTACLCN